MGDNVTITLREDEHLQNFENALEALEKHEDVKVSRSRGRTAADEISVSEAVNELAIAYTGHDTAEGEL